MARPGEVGPALYEGLPYGQNALANDMSEALPDDDDDLDPTFDEMEDFAPAGEEEEFLFSPTARPDEPRTAGMSFGPGPNIAGAMLQSEGRREFASRIRNTLAAEGESSPGLQKFLAAMDRGL